MILLSSALRPPGHLGIPALAQLCGEVGGDGLALGAGFWLAMLPTLRAECAGVGVPIRVMLAPVPEVPLAEGKRMPHLAAHDDKEERLAAVEHVRKVMEAGREAGAIDFAVHFGRVAMRAPEAEVMRSIHRSEMSEGQPGARALTLVLEERRKVDERVLDACRRSLEDVVRLCERIGVRAAIHLGNRPWRAPGPREALALLRDFSGGPVGLVWAPARLAALAAMGLPSSPERHAELRRVATLVHLSDAVGVHDDLLPGLGECAAEDFDGIDVNVPVILAGRADSSAQEIASAREAVENRLRQRARSAAS